jgi:hypothetical protein
MPSDTEIAPSGLPPQDTKGKLWADTYNSVLYPVWMEELVSGWLLSVWSRKLSEGRKKFRELRDEGNKLISDAPPDIALTKGRKLKIQEELDSILKREGYLL